MKKLLLNKLLIVLLLLPVFSLAQSAEDKEQDITGLWKGTLYNDTTQKYLPYEVAISEEKGKLTGYSYTMFDIDGKKEIGVKRIKLKRDKDEIIIEDVELISNTYSEPPPKKVRVQSIVNLIVNDTAMILSGKWSTNRTREYRQLTGSLQLQRAVDYSPVTLYKLLAALKLDQELSFVKPVITPQPASIAVNAKPLPEPKKTQEQEAGATDIARAITTPEIKNGVAVETPSSKETKPVETIVAKTGAEPGKIAAPVEAINPQGVGNNKTVNKEVKPEETVIAKTGTDKPAVAAIPTVVKKQEVVVNNKQAEKETKPSETIIAKPGVDKPEKPAVPTMAKKQEAVVNKKVDEETKPAETVIAKVDTDKPKAVVNNKQPAKEARPEETLLAKSGTDKSAKITSEIADKKTEPVVENKSINKEIKPVEQTVKGSSATKPALTDLSVANKKPVASAEKDTAIKKAILPKDLVKQSIVKPAPVKDSMATKKTPATVAVNEPKKEKAQAAVPKPAAIAPPPATKKPETVVATVKEPSTRQQSSVKEVDKKAVPEKPVTVAAAVVSKPAPAVTLTDTVKKAALAVVLPEAKREAPVVVIAPKAPVAAEKLAERKIKNEQSVFFESDSLVFTLYDNGDVDGDTVSVVMNGQLIFAKQGLSTKANSKTIYMDKGMPDTISMVMYAENLGSIPPNTGLMIIMDGEKRYEVRFSADLQTNAAVILRRKPKE